MYSRIVKQERKRAAVLQSIPVGKIDRIILSAGKCVGSTSTSLSSAGDYELLSTGLLRASLTSKPYTATISFKASFNALGQLGGSVIKVQVGDVNILVGTTEINPIKLIFKGNFGKRKIEFKRAFPGPIELLENSDGTYRIYYKHGKFPNVAAADFDEQPLLKLLKFEMRNQAPESALCAAGQEDLVNLDPVMRSILKALSQFSVAGGAGQV
ncbi:hypothetical protein OAO01_06800 [Oligoflexia bacterium]|nr:hypothetical protein [Oligoflexia bacterium]